MNKNNKFICIVALMTLIFSMLVENIFSIAIFKYVNALTFTIGYGIVAYILGKYIKDKINSNNKNHYIIGAINIYILFQFIYLIISGKMINIQLISLLLQPQGFNFILLAFIISIILLPYFSRNKSSILISIILAIIAMTINNEMTFGMLKILSIFPYILIGYNEKEFLKNNKTDRKSILRAIVFTLIMILTILLASYYIDARPFINFKNIKNLELNVLYVVISRILMYIYTFVAIKILLGANSKTIIKLSNLFGNIGFELIIVPIIFELILIYISNLEIVSFTPRVIHLPIVILFVIALTYIISKLPKVKLLDKVDNSKNINSLEKIKNKDLKYYLSNFINSPLVILLLFVFIIIKLIFFWNNTYRYSINYTNYMFVNIIFILVLSSPLLFVRKAKKRILVITIIDIIISLILLADNLYYNYSSNLISFMQVGNLKYTKEIVSVLPDLINIKYLLYFIDVFLFLIIYKFSKNSNSKNMSKSVSLAVYLSILALIYPKFVSNMIFSSQIFFDKGTQVNLTSLFAYHINDISNLLNIKKSIIYNDVEEIKEDIIKIDSEKEIKVKEDITGIAKGKNVIVVQLEAVENFLVNKSLNGVEILPNINKFVNENVNISNMYMQSYSTTADSEFAFSTGLYPIENGQSFEKYFASTYPNIYKILSKEGYYTAYTHGNRSNFWNREATYKSFGVDYTKYMSDYEDTSDIIVGFMSDESVYRQIIPEMKNYKEPYIQTIVAASSHAPFDLGGLSEEDKKIKASMDLGKYDDTIVGRYIESCRYADYAFGKFIEQLKAEGIYDDTVIFVFGDHCGPSKEDESVKMFLEETQNKSITNIDAVLRYINVMAAIKVPGIEHMTIDWPTSKIDVKSTILDILGVEDIMSLGDSIFNDREYVSLNNGNIITKDYYYESKWYDIKTGKEVDLEKLNETEKEKLNKYIENSRIKINISNAIGIKNMLNEKK